MSEISDRLENLRQDRSSRNAIGGGVQAPSRPVTTVVTIQYLRAIAASLVVLQHAMGVPLLAAYYQQPFGQFGVDLFFVISGYIMWTTTVDGRRGALAFWSARLVRIVPIYWIFTTLYIAVAIVLPTAVFTASLDPIFVAKSYLFVPAENPRAGNISPVYTLGWTLNYEMFFYFAFGCCLLIRSPTLRLTGIVGMLGLLVSAGAYASPRGAIAIVYTDPILLEFAAGIVLAVLSSRLSRVTAPFGWALMGTAIVWLGVVHVGPVNLEPVLAHGVPAAALVAGGLILEPAARARTSRLGLLLGDASYSIYLAHPFALRIWYFAFTGVAEISSFALAAVFVVTAIVAGVCAGVAGYLLMEQPLLVAGRRLAGRHARAA